MSITDSRSSSRSPGGFFSRASFEAALPHVLKWLSVGLTILIFCLITLGALVRKNDAGLACPDWPLCFGEVVPPMDYQIFLEWFHRLIAGFVSTIFLTISTLVFIKSELRKRFAKYCVGGFVLLASQVVLGGLTVLGLLAPKWVSSHLMVGLGFFCVNVLLTLGLADWVSGRSEASTTTKKQLSGLAWTSFLLLYFQIFLGGLVSSNYAGLACPDFPTCHGFWIPPLEGLVKFQFLHRLGAVVSTVILCVLAYKGLTRTFTARANLFFRLIPLFLVIQVCLGVSGVLFQLPLLVSVAHLAVATALLGSVMVVIYEIKRS